MSEALRTYRTARTKKRCDGFPRCRRGINPSERCVRVSLPPRGDMGNVSWWSMNICIDCMRPDDRKKAEQ